MPVPCRFVTIAQRHGAYLVPGVGMVRGCCDHRGSGEATLERGREVLPSWASAAATTAQRQ